MYRYTFPQERAVSAHLCPIVTSCHFNVDCFCQSDDDVEVGEKMCLYSDIYDFL